LYLIGVKQKKEENIQRERSEWAARSQDGNQRRRRTRGFRAAINTIKSVKSTNFTGASPSGEGGFAELDAPLHLGQGKPGTLTGLRKNGMMVLSGLRAPETA
jgi:hypothetical protein